MSFWSVFSRFFEDDLFIQTIVFNAYTSGYLLSKKHMLKALEVEKLSLGSNDLNINRKSVNE